MAELISTRWSTTQPSRGLSECSPSNKKLGPVFDTYMNPLGRGPEERFLLGTQFLVVTVSQRHYLLKLAPSL